MNSQSLWLSNVPATLGGLRRHPLFQILFGITFGALAALSAAPQAADPPVRIEIGNLPPEVGQWEPVWIELRFHNESFEPVQVNLGPKRKANTAISVSRQGSELLAVPLQLSGFSPPSEVEVQAGAIFTSKILLNERYPALPAGSYVLSVRFLGSAKLGGRSWTISAERRFEVRIAAADRYRLAAVCADLARQVVEAETAEQTMNAADALSYVTHPVAIPFVSGLLNNQIAVKYLMAGLGRIGDAEASEVLINALDLSGNSGRVAGFARMALHSILPGTSGELRKRIQEALKLYRAPTSDEFK